MANFPFQLLNVLPADRPRPIFTYPFLTKNYGKKSTVQIRLLVLDLRTPRAGWAHLPYHCK